MSNPATDVPPAVEPLKFAEPAKFGPMGAFAVDFVHEVPLSTPQDRILDSDYWRGIANRPDLRPGGIIRCLCESPAYIAELLIREVNAFAGYVAVVLLRRVALPDAHQGAGDDVLPANHSIRYLGPQSRWALLRGTQSLKDSFESRADALRYARDLGRVSVS